MAGSILSGCARSYKAIVERHSIRRHACVETKSADRVRALACFVKTNFCFDIEKIKAVCERMQRPDCCRGYFRIPGSTDSPVYHFPGASLLPSTPGECPWDLRRIGFFKFMCYWHARADRWPLRQALRFQTAAARVKPPAWPARYLISCTFLSLSFFRRSWNVTSADWKQWRISSKSSQMTAIF